MKKVKVTAKIRPKKILRKFPYKLEYCPNPDCIQICARSRFPSSDSMDLIDLRYSNKSRQMSKRHPLFAKLSKITGLKSAFGRGYSLQVVKANSLFTWDKLLPKVLRAVQETVAGKRMMSRVGEPKRPSEAELRYLRSQGCNV